MAKISTYPVVTPTVDDLLIGTNGTDGRTKNFTVGAVAALSGAADVATALSVESAARAAADSTLQTGITSESSARAAADTALQASIDAEATARASADSTHAALTSGAHGGIVPSARTLTLNGVAQDLSANRSWTITGGQGMRQTTADATGVTDATAQLQADLVTAVAAGHKRLYLPAGTYKIVLTTGTLFNLTSDNTEVFGDGIGKTILQLPASTTLTAALFFFKMAAKHQWIHDLSIQVGAGAAGSFDMIGIAIVTGAFYPRVTRVEIGGIYGSSTAGGSGINLSQTYSQTEASTTLGTTIASGARTVTPGSMDGIYVGRRLSIGGTAEDVIVTAITETTFTATFANAHNSSDSVTITSYGAQYALIEDCLVRDSFKACGFIVNSSNNTFRRCKAVKTGSTSGQHAFYMQGGHNLYEGCDAEGAGGYSFHGYKQVQSIDGSGDKLIGCTSIQPGFQHAIFNSLASNATNPNVPTTLQLTRYVQVIGCTFRNLNAVQRYGLEVVVPALIANNVFEDVCQAGGFAIKVTSGGAGTLIIGNRIGTVNPASTNGSGILAADQSIIDSNTIDMTGLNTGISVSGASTVIRGNRVVLPSGGSGNGLNLNANNLTVSDNRIEVNAGNAITFGTISGLRMQGNTFACTGSATICNMVPANVGGDVVNNVFSGSYWRYSSANNGLRIGGNTGQVSQGGQQAYDLDAAAGQLAVFTTDGSAMTRGRSVKLSAGVITVTGTGDTVFAGILASSVGAAVNNMYVVAQPGAIVPVEADAAWVAGHYGIPSVTTAGKIHDSGTSAPAVPASYGIFLDAGGSAGVARFMLVKTL